MSPPLPAMQPAKPAALRPAPGVPAAGYAKPARLQPIDINLDANEGASVPKLTLDVMAARAVTASALRQYPEADSLQSAIAQTLSVRPEQVLVTAGADDALDRIAASTLSASHPAATTPYAPPRAVLTTPTFEMIGRYVRLRGGIASEVPWLDGPLPIDEISLAITSNSAPARVVFLVTPNNPTGAAVSASQVSSVLSVCRSAGTVLCIDQAYGEFADTDLCAQFASEPGVVITRTFSKAWGLAGLRIGYAVGDPQIISWMRAVGQPFAASAVSLSIAQQWLAQGRPAMQAFVGRVRAERTALSALLRSTGQTVIESHANFVLARFADNPASNHPRGSRALLIADLLAAQGIAVRTFSREPLFDMLRITLPGDEAIMLRLTSALHVALIPGRGDFALCQTSSAVTAARAAGSLAIGLLAEDSSVADVEALLRAGAARVISSPSQLSSLIAEANS